MTEEDKRMVSHLGRMLMEEQDGLRISLAFAAGAAWAKQNRVHEGIGAAEMALRAASELRGAMGNIIRQEDFERGMDLYFRENRDDGVGGAIVSHLGEN